MKKRIPALLASLIFLCSCSENKISSLPDNQSSDSSSQVVSTSDTVSSSSKETSSFLSSSFAEEDNSIWDEESAKTMRNYLGGKTIPSLDFGEYTLYTHMSNCIEVRFKEISQEDTYDQYKTFLESEGWTTSLTTNVYRDLNLGDTHHYLFAKSPDQKLSLYACDQYFFVSDDPESEEKCFVILCHYDCPYEEMTSTSWPEDIQETMNDYLGNHEIPYFHFGQDFLTFERTYKASQNDEDRIKIYGGKYDPQIFNDIETTFQGQSDWTVNHTLTNSLNWGITFNDSLTLDKQFDDKKEIHIEIATLDNYYSEKFAGYTMCMIIYFRDTYDIENAPTSWSSTIQNDLNLQFDNHSIPCLYLGTEDILTSQILHPYNDSYMKYKMIGEIWNDAMIEDNKEILENDGWTISEEKETDLCAYKMFSDNDFLFLSLFKNTSGLATLTIRSTENATYSMTCGSWGYSAYTQDHLLPYFTLNSEYVTYNPSGNHAYVTGGIFNLNVFTNAKETLELDGFETEYLSLDSLQISFRATKIYDDGAVLTIDLGVESNDKFKLIFYYLSSGQESMTSWDDSVLTMMNETCDNHEIPVLEMNCSTLSSCEGPYSYLYGAYSHYLCLEGGEWFEQLADTNQAILEADGWTCSTRKYNNNLVTFLTAVKSFEDGCRIEISIGGYIGSKISVYIYYYEPYDSSLAMSEEWNEEDNESISMFLNGHTLDYLYLGKKRPEFSLGITHVGVFVGGEWNEEILSVNQQSLQSKGWACQMENSMTYASALNSKNVLVATKTFEDGFSLKVEIGSYYEKQAKAIVTFTENN